MPRVHGISHKILTRRALKEARKVPIEKTDSFGSEDGEEREELGRCYPKKKIQIVEGMHPDVEGETVTHELLHNRGGIIGKSEKLTERAGRITFERMTKRQHAELHRRVPH